MVTNYLLIINIVVYILLMLTGEFLGDFLPLNFYLWLPETIFSFKIWEFVTYMFIHDLSSILHIAFNMLALVMFGKEIERHIGHVNFLIFYFVCGIGAGLIQMITQFVQLIFASINNNYSILEVIAVSKVNPTILFSADVVPVVGASGAIFGLLFAYAKLFPERELAIYGIIPMKAKYFVMVFGGLELVLGLSGIGRVAHFAHLGGIVFGWIYFKYLIYPVNDLVRKKFLNLERFFMKKSNGY